MKTLLRSILGYAGISLLIAACDDYYYENVVRPIPTIEFENLQSSIKENDGEQSLTISFNKPFSYNATINVLVDTSKSKYFTSIPAAVQGKITLAVQKNDTKAIIKFTPKDNTISDGTKRIRLQITRLHNEFILGEKDSHEVTIEDNDVPGQTRDSYVGFIPSNATVKENESQWHELQIQVSDYATANGSLTIESHSTHALYGTHYLTEPAFVDNRLTLTANSGTQILKFKVRAVNDNVISGHSSINFKIKETTGNLKIGANIQDSVVVVDDELSGLPKGYEINAGSWGLKNTYEYDAKGRIYKIYWQTRNPGSGSGVDTYYYNTFDQLVRINKSAGNDLLYTHVDDRIVMEQKVRNGIIERYTKYEYDQSGNVGAMQTHHLQPDGSFLVTSTVVLLYHFNGNLYKTLLYTHDAENPNELILASTETFDHYLDVENPFSMVDIHPNVKTQKHLPAAYRVEANGHDLLYNFSYEFREDRKVVKRTATRANTTETTLYYYY